MRIRRCSSRSRRRKMTLNQRIARKMQNRFKKLRRNSSQLNNQREKLKKERRQTKIRMAHVTVQSESQKTIDSLDFKDERQSRIARKIVIGSGCSIEKMGVFEHVPVVVLDGERRVALVEAAEQFEGCLLSTGQLFDQEDDQIWCS